MPSWRRCNAGSAVLAFLAAPAWSASLNNADLIKAVRAGDITAVHAMIQRGANVNEPEANGTTALHWAAYQEDVPMVKSLLAAGAKVRVANEFGSSPMQEAAIAGNSEIIRLLLAAGADADSANAEGQTALMAVARTGNVEAAKLLLNAGAHVNAVENFGGQSALMWAAGQCQPAMIKLLVEHGANVNARGAVRDWQTRITSEPRPKDRHRGGFTPLLYTAREGCADAARALVEGGADLNLADPERVTPLVLALLNEHFDYAAYLISAGADVDKWDLYGRSPIYAAVDLSTLPTGGRPDTPSMDKTTANEVIEVLLNKGANPNLQLKLRPPYRNVPFDRGGDQVLSTGATALLRASKAGDNPVAMKLLLEHGALVDLPNTDGVTPLMIAAGMGHTNNPTRGRYQTDEDAAVALKILLKAGANIHRRAANGQTALHAAALKGWNQTIRLLAEYGAELEPKDNNGKTPLDYASGNYRNPQVLGGNLVPPAPQPETMKVLQELIAAKAGTPTPK
ncbi:MAG TPA: ankyrin repeat domain-containing protein [Bryobacteraceae bacterium]|nr:ankyrin repeat domain-containing protein [Bryobacteraceae bacterium]